jgi:hypothetical protein
MPGVGSTKVKAALREEPQVKPEKVFGAETFELLAQRVVRKHITQQYCEPDHPVLKTEESLIEQSAAKVRQHLVATEAEWQGLAFRLRKITVVKHLRELAKERLRDHVEIQDLDEDVAKNALESIMELDFEQVFPKSWVDG